MSKYAYVSVPFAGSVTVRVSTEGCESCAEVVDRAVQKAGEAIYLSVDQKIALGDVEPGDMEVMTRLVEGNVCFAPLHEAGIESEHDEDEDDDE